MSGSRALVVADFTADPLVGLLASGGSVSPTEVSAAPYGQVVQTLAEVSRRSEPDRLEFIVVWTRPESAIPGYARMLATGAGEDAEIDDDVSAFSQAILAAANGARVVIVPTWVAAAQFRAQGPLAFRKGAGTTRALLRMNLALADTVLKAPNVIVLDAARWMALSGRRAMSPKSWFAGKVPFSLSVFEEAAADISAALRAVRGQSTKAVVLDLDGTLWGGIVGEVGPEGVQLGGHDATGEAFVEFQKRLKALRSRGVVLAIASKNDESTAMQAIEGHPEMVLRRSDFAAWRINWRDKAANIAELADELNLGVDALLFIDDSAAERARVREGLAGVIVPEWPDDPSQYASALDELRYFDRVSLTSEDRSRADAYRVERERTESRNSFGSLDAWLADLKLVIKVENLNGSNLARATQLLNKTNQLNVATRRLGEAELLEWANRPSREILAFRVHDKFGDYGLTGLVGVEVIDEVAHARDYLLSCRVMGRGVEATMLALLIERARRLGASRLELELFPTARNGPTREFLDSGSRLRHIAGTDKYEWAVSDSYDVPSHVMLNRAEPLGADQGAER